MTETSYGTITAGWRAGTVERMATGTGPEVQTDVNGASPHLLAGQERDWLYGHGRTHHQVNR